MLAPPMLHLNVYRWRSVITYAILGLHHHLTCSPTAAPASTTQPLRNRPATYGVVDTPFLKLSNLESGYSSQLGDDSMPAPLPPPIFSTTFIR